MNKYEKALKRASKAVENARKREVNGSKLREAVECIYPEFELRLQGKHKAIDTEGVEILDSKLLTD